jgi:phage shock protein A
MAIVKKRRATRPRRAKSATIVKVSAPASSSELGNLREQVGELHGLFKAHIKETERDRTAAREWRDETKIERHAAIAARRSLEGLVEKVSGAVQIVADRVERVEHRADDTDEKLAATETRLKDSESFIANIKTKIAIATGIIGGAVGIVVYVLHLFSHEIKALLLKPFQ